MLYHTKNTLHTCPRILSVPSLLVLMKPICGTRSRLRIAPSWSAIVLITYSHGEEVRVRPRLRLLQRLRDILHLAILPKPKLKSHNGLVHLHPR